MRDINMKPLQSFERIMRILNCFSFEKPYLTIDGIIEMTGHPRSTAYRMLVTLEKSGLIQFDQRENTYRLGHKFMEFGGIVLQNLDIRREAESVVVDIHKTTGQTVLLAVRENDFLRYLHSYESKEIFQPRAYVGRSRILHNSPLGVLLMAYMPVEEVKELLSRHPLEKKTPYAITDHDQFFLLLKEIKKDGFYIHSDEYFVGFSAIVVPVLGRSGDVLAAITVAGQNHIIRGKEEQNFLSLLQESAQKISKRLGFV